LWAPPRPMTERSVVGDPFRCRSWEPKTREAEEWLERWLREAREGVRVREAPGEREEKEGDVRED
jgi:hypothetical protein